MEISLADLDDNSDDSFRNIKLIVNDVQGKNCLTSFCGMNFTSDKLRSLVKKSHTLIETFTDIKTSEGYLLRVFIIGFTFRQKSQVRKTTYANTSKIKLIRRKMIETIHDDCRHANLEHFIRNLVSEVAGKRIEKACAGIFPLANVHIRKVKVLKFPRREQMAPVVLPDFIEEEANTSLQQPAPVADAEDDGTSF